MEDRYVKPGNQERGWNDPPQFSYGLQMARGPQRNLLNKRAAPPSASGTGPDAPLITPPTSNPLGPPPCCIATPPPNPARPPPGGVATPPPHVGPTRKQSEANAGQSEREPDVEAVMSLLSRALEACRHSVQAQVCNDVAKRLRLLEDSWRTGRLSLPVRRRMDTLSLELQSGRWDSADEIHRSLMVDHVTEVSQWMVGVKRLIAETRNLSPDLLETLQNPTEMAQDPAVPVEPAQDPAVPVEPAQDPAVPVEPAQDPAVPVEPAQDPAVPAEPVQDPVELVQGSDLQS